MQKKPLTPEELDAKRISAEQLSARKLRYYKRLRKELRIKIKTHELTDALWYLAEMNHLQREMDMEPIDYSTLLKILSEINKAPKSVSFNSPELDEFLTADDEENNGS